MIRILDLNTVSFDEILARSDPQQNVSAQVSEIIDTVVRQGDKALMDYTRRFDGVELKSLCVTEEEIDKAVQATEPEFMRILERAAQNIRAFHEKQKRTGFIITREDGVVMGQKVVPLERVALYVPGGTAAYPSSVLMDAIPAKLAGVTQLCIATPPAKDGSVNPAILASARVAGVDRIYKMGGAQAIAALAYGTESVTRVDKIVGPGNAYVNEAKKQVFGRVAIDMIAGPSEIMILSDGKTRADVLAADLLSQAEHDKASSAVLVTDCPELAKQVQTQLEAQLTQLERREIARASIDNNGKIIVARDLAEAMDVVNALAPEHLELCVDDPFALLGRVKHAGSVFLGRSCPEALGDYMAGPNHTLPTLGTARFSSPLSVDDFIKKTQFTYYTPEALEKVAQDVASFARREGLTAHAKSALIRGEVKA
ncbi:MAG: histidinol dehydrogenase [Clostridia bacterium]|nr:histidinol dehydrogenase [Clostridia bacterium]